MKLLRIGLVHEGDETNDIWGSAITTMHLEESFKKLGHQTWRASVTCNQELEGSYYEDTDLLISEGVAKWLVPENVWRGAKIKVLWWLSNLYYDREAVMGSGFDGIATNSYDEYRILSEAGVETSYIDLCAQPELATAHLLPESFTDHCVYLGCFPHKTDEQMALLFEPASEFGFGLWGKGWEESCYKDNHRGVLRLGDIGSLYRSTPVALLLTETTQKRRSMINNRVYEVLASGCIPISEPYEYLENHELGEFISFAHSQDEVRELLQRSRLDVSLKQMALEGQKVVLEKHTYDARVGDFLRFYTELASG